jgi:uncharacterized membrane protein YfcA
MFAVSLAAGALGALAGVGGGILIIPALTILFGVDIRLAIGASIVSVIATSSGAAAAYVRDRLTNLRIGMFLEIATTSGAVAGALLGAVVAPAFLYVLLGVVLLLSAGMQVARLGEELPPSRAPSDLATRLALGDSYPDRRLGRDVSYAPQRIPLGLALMALAGMVSGVTAAASAGIYIARGDVDVRIASPVALGVLAGAYLGARLLGRLSNTAVRRIFVPVLAAVGIETILRGLGVGL